MPERHKMVSFLTERILGTQVWNGLTGECRTMPTDEFLGLHALIDEAYVGIVDEMLNWNRVFLTAGTVCREKRDRNQDHNADPYDHEEPEWKDFCPNCFVEAMLSDETGGYDLVEKGAPRETTYKESIEAVGGKRALVERIAPRIIAQLAKEDR